MNNLNIVTIGGGTGSPVVLESLILAGFEDIKAICAAMDTGGRTGWVRTDERDQVISVSDLWRNLIALIPTHEHHLSKSNIDAFRELIGYTDGRNRNLGYTIYYGLLEKYHNDFLEVQKLLERLLGMQMAGQAIPVTLKPTNIYFLTQSGITHKGENALDNYSMSRDMVDHVWVDPPVEATKEATEAIEEATHIIYSPGSLYGSVISNFLPSGVETALQKSSAIKICVSNLVSTRNQTHKFTPEDYWQLFSRYPRLRRPFDVFIVPLSPSEEFKQEHHRVFERYAQEHSYFLKWTPDELAVIEAEGVKVVMDEIYSVTPELERLRHNPQKLSGIFKNLIGII